jgi:hypothetical protein
MLLESHAPVGETTSSGDIHEWCLPVQQGKVPCVRCLQLQQRIECNKNPDSWGVLRCPSPKPRRAEFVALSYLQASMAFKWTAVPTSLRRIKRKLRILVASRGPHSLCLRACTFVHPFAWQFQPVSLFVRLALYLLVRLLTWLISVLFIYLFDVWSFSD